MRVYLGNGYDKRLQSAAGEHLKGASPHLGMYVEPDEQERPALISHKAVRLFMERLPYPTAVVHKDGEILKVNTAWTELFQVPSDFQYGTLGEFIFMLIMENRGSGKSVRRGTTVPELGTAVDGCFVEFGCVHLDGDAWLITGEQCTCNPEEIQAVGIMKSLGSALGRARSLDEGLCLGLECLLEIPHICDAAVYVLREHIDGLQLLAHAGDNKELAEQFDFFPNDSKAVQEIKKGKILHGWESLVEEWHAAKKFGILGTAVVPVFFEDEIVGAYVASSQKYPHLPVFIVNMLEIGASFFGGLLVAYKADEKTKESVHFFKQLIDNQPDMIWALDKDHTMRFVGGAVERMFGYTAEEFVKLPPSVYLSPDSRMEAEWWKKRRQDAETSGFPNNEGYLFELEQYHKDGSVVYTETKTTPMRDRNGTLTGFAGVTRDITARKQTLRRMNTLEKRYQAVFENSPHGVAVFEVDEKNTRLRLVDCNTAYAHYAGRSKQEMLEHPDVTEFYQEQGTSDKWESTWKSIRAGEKYRGTYSWNRPDGRENYIEYHSVPLGTDEGKLVFVFNQDITARHSYEKALRESEAFLRQLIEQLSDYIFVVVDSRSNRLIYLSPSCDGVWKDGRWELFDNPALAMDLIHPEDGDRLIRAYKESKDSGSNMSEEIRIRPPDGRERRYKVRAFPIYNWSGEVFRIVGVLEDITEEHRRELMLRQSQRMEAVGTMAGGIAHDFNNILGVIIKNAEMITPENAPSPSFQNRKQRILNAGLRARDIVRQILSFSRMDTQVREPVVLADLVSESISLLRSSFPSTIDIQYRTEDTKSMISAEPAQIETVMMNLGLNAQHAMGEKGGTLKVSLQRVQLDEADCRQHYPNLEPGAYLKLVIADNGCGMSPAEQEKIFEPFYTTKPKDKGTGLGLFVVHSVVKRHGGYVAVRSKEGKGTTFEMLFLITDSIDICDAKNSFVDDISSKPTVFVVDDEEDYRDTLQELLDSLGCEIVRAETAQEALDIFTNDPQAADVLITDQTMPGMTGMELATRFRSLRKDMPIVISTGFSEYLDREEMDSIGAALLMKPFTKDELAQCLSDILANRKNDTSFST